MVYSFIMMKRFFISAALFVLCAAGISYAQFPGETPVHWTAAGPPASVSAGGRFVLTIKASIDGDWHLYSVTQPPGGPYATKFTIPSGSEFEFNGAIGQSEPAKEFDPNFGIETETFSSEAEFRIPFRVLPGVEPGGRKARIQVSYQVCNDTICLPPRTVAIPFSLEVAPGGAEAETANTGTVRAEAPAAETAQARRETATAANPESEMPAGTAAEVKAARAGGFLPFLWLAMTMGALSLATPCVFPMIPITVSYFTKNAEDRKSSGISHAVVYSLGIIFTFTGLGLGLAALLGATGINRFAANPWVNLLITAVFLGFALNLFGLYQIGVPSSVLTRLSRAGAGTGYPQTLLMGLTFTLTSFTCTVPFVGTVLVATSQGDWLWPAMGMLGFSVVFAAPFFLLALLPRLLTAMPRSGGWLNSVKVTMGFLELAAAMKFLSNADLVWNWHIFTRVVVLSIWIATAVLATVYLLGKFRLPHDSPIESLGVLRMTSALAFLAVGFYLFTGLMGGSLGELDAFLPPRTAGSFTLTGSGPSGRELSWHTNLEEAMAMARREQKPVFIDFTGYTCTNCRWMEANIFTRPDVHTGLEKFVRVQLYTDGAGKEYQENQDYQRKQYGTVALPLYVILDSEGNKVAVFPGMTRKPEEFLKFLATPFGAS